MISKNVKNYYLHTREDDKGLQQKYEEDLPYLPLGDILQI